MVRKNKRTYGSLAQLSRVGSGMPDFPMGWVVDFKNSRANKVLW